MSFSTEHRAVKAKAMTDFDLIVSENHVFAEYSVFEGCRITRFIERKFKFTDDIIAQVRNEAEPSTQTKLIAYTAKELNRGVKFTYLVETEGDYPMYLFDVVALDDLEVRYEYTGKIDNQEEFAREFGVSK